MKIRSLVLVGLTLLVSGGIVAVYTLGGSFWNSTGTRGLVSWSVLRQMIWTRSGCEVLSKDDVSLITRQNIGLANRNGKGGHIGCTYFLKGNGPRIRVVSFVATTDGSFASTSLMKDNKMQPTN